MKKRVVLFSILFVVMLTNASWAGPRKGYSTPVCDYTTASGLKIESYSKYWNTKEKLRQVYVELTKNTIGSEIKALKTIYLYPDIEEGVAGYYSADVAMNNAGEFKMGVGSYIVVLGCDTGSSLSYIAQVLTHEYAHHFATYHLVTNEKKYGQGWLDTEYAKIRDLKKYTKTVYYNPITSEHKWDIAEIIANDYIELFGAPSSKTSIDYKDAKERLEEGLGDLDYRFIAFNADPQENLEIPLATSVSGLYKYLTTLSGVVSKTLITPKMPQMTVAKKYILLSKYKGFVIEWDPINDGKTYEYTLVMHPANNSENIIPIKTLYEGEKMQAYIGSYKDDGFESSRAVIESFSGKYEVRLFIKDDKGFVFEARSISIDFNENITTTLDTSKTSLFTDLSSAHWAYDDIVYLTKKKIITGYVDKTFKPEYTIKKSEFMAMLMKCSNINLSKYKKISDDWFIRDGYYNAAIDYGIVTADDYGGNIANFKYNESITREEMAFMLGRVLIVNRFSIDINTDYTKRFTDTIKPRFKLEINLVLKYSILEGYEDNTFRGTRYATRAEASRLIYNLVKLFEKYNRLSS